MLRRVVLLLAFLPALCLGLLGQGRGMVLCQTARGACLEVEGTCRCADESERAPESALAQGKNDGAHIAGEKHCHDSSLDAGPCALANAEKAFIPGFFVVGLLSFPPRIQVSHAGGQWSSHLTRGPPHPSAPPQILLCLSHVVMLV